MTGRGRSLCPALAAAALILGVAGADAPPAGAALYQPQLLNLRAADESAWHADDDFQLRWDRPTWAGFEVPVTAVHYEIEDAAGNLVVPDVRIAKDVNLIDHVHVPSRPGAYKVHVWLEGSSGGSGDPQSATLRFDDARPGVAQPLVPAGWIGADSAPILHLEHPAGPLPASGIRGYAVSIGPDAAGSPCAGPDRCSETETDLRGGIGADTMALAGLPEGIGYLHAYAVSGSGMRSALAGGTILHVDATRPEVELRGVPRTWASGPVSLSAHAVDRLSGMIAAGPAGPYTAIAVDGRLPKSAGGDTASAVVSGEGRHRITAFARDAAGNISGESGGSAAAVEVDIDEGPPRVAFSRSQDPADPEQIEATVADGLSGADGMRGSIAVRPAGTRRQFTTLPTTGSQGKLTARWDSDSFAAGSYEFRATGYDLAGNSTAADRRSTGARMVLPNPLKRVTKIEAGFGGRRLIWHRCVRVDGGRRCRRQVVRSFGQRPATRTAPYGHGLSFSGRLTSKSGAPLGGLPVQVIETFDAGAILGQRTTTVQTAADGVFLAYLSPGPDRQVEAVFAGNRILTRALAPQRPRLAVLSGVRMHASATTALVGGAPVVFSGQLQSSGASIPSGGMPVEFQYRLPGTEWTGFHTVKTDAEGRFRYPYAFSDDDSRGARFEFRAYVPAQEGWPYEPAGSQPVFVTGR